MTKPPTPEREAKIRRVLSHRQHDLALVVANVHDPHNVSAIYRSCDAFGIPKVHLYYTRTAFPHLGEKSSASARKWVESERHKTPEDLMAALKAKSMRVYATSCSPSARPITEYDLTGPVAVIMGNEHGGVDEDLLPLVDGELYIPMYGMIQSFNVSVAAALILSEASRQRALAGKYDSPTCLPDEMEERVQTWLKK
jgi:tRNA (guanosine-2'-O-)-methyltransferase